jgi:hypothetical protein
MISWFFKSFLFHIARGIDFNLPGLARWERVSFDMIRISADRIDGIEEGRYHLCRAVFPVSPRERNKTGWNLALCNDSIRKQIETSSILMTHSSSVLQQSRDPVSCPWNPLSLRTPQRWFSAGHLQRGLKLVNLETWAPRLPHSAEVTIFFCKGRWTSGLVNLRHLTLKNSQKKRFKDLPQVKTIRCFIASGNHLVYTVFQTV